MHLTAEIDHIALNCRDARAQLKFYTTVLTFAPEGVEEFEAGKMPFPSCRVSEATILDFFPNDHPKGPTAVNHVCFNIPRTSFPALKKRLEDDGMNVMEPVRRGGARGTAWSIYISDPEGNNIEIRWYD